MHKLKRIGILTGGGDAPGLNAVIRAVVKAGVNNGIENEPAVTIEDEKDVWTNYASWPIPGTENVNVFLRGTGDNAAAGTLGGSSGGAADTVNFTGTAALTRSLWTSSQ